MSTKYWCFYCYGLNPQQRGACVHCGQPVEGPPGQSFDDQLVWTLGHPDGDRAMLAAQVLGRRRVGAAVPALQRVVDQNRDPYLAATALRSAITIAGRDELRGWLNEIANCDSFMVRTIAQQALHDG